MLQRRSVRRFLFKAAGSLALVLALFAAVVFVLESDLVARRVTGLLTTKLSFALGRATHLAAMKIEVFPRARISLRGFSVAGRPSEPPLVEWDELRVEFGLWPILRSFGKRVEIRSLVLSRPSLAVVQAPNGTFSYEGVGRGAGSTGGAIVPALRVNAFRVENALVRLIYRSRGKKDEPLTKLLLPELKGTASLAPGELNLHAEVFGGHVSANATRVDAAGDEPTYKFEASLDALDVAQALAALSKAPTLAGKLSGNMGVTGAGVEWTALRDRLLGDVTVSFREGALVTSGFGGDLAGSVSSGLAAIGIGKAPKDRHARGVRTALKEFSCHFRVEKGTLSTQSAIVIQSGLGTLSVSGQIGLDGRLDLRGKAVVSGVDLPLSITGTAANPNVGVRADEAIAGAVHSLFGNVKARKGEPAKAVKRATGPVAEQARR